MLPSRDFATYRRPLCKGSLSLRDASLGCSACGKTYPVRKQIPDFILEDLSQSEIPVLRGVKGIDRLARIYETRFWYPVVLNLVVGWGQASMPGIVGLVKEMLGLVSGLILDVACGPGTYGRRLADPSRMIYGIDVSQGMLEQGMVFAQREQVMNIAFARAKVENLPFGDRVFDGAVCSGSLHLFPDAGLALREIRRTLKPGAPLAIITFTPGKTGLLRFRRFRERACKKGLRVFQVAELAEILALAGFSDVSPTTFGSGLACRAIRC
jgi:SAM-dependent methyltransferase